MKELITDFNEYLFEKENKEPEKKEDKKEEPKEKSEDVKKRETGALKSFIGSYKQATDIGNKSLARMLKNSIHSLYKGLSNYADAKEALNKLEDFESKNKDKK